MDRTKEKINLLLLEVATAVLYERWFIYTSQRIRMIHRKLRLMPTLGYAALGSLSAYG